LCVLAVGPVASAQQSTPAGEAGNLPSAARFQSAWPRTLPQSKPGEMPAEDPAWSVEEVERARGRCAELLQGLEIVAIPLAPLREGAECGAPAPLQLVSVGNNPQIAFSPPPVLTCDMVAALYRWLQREVQPLARKHLGAPIVSVATMSSFSCRMAYSRASGRLSEHGRVNAIDISGFLTAAAKAAVVVADWGPVAREIAAQATQAEARQRRAGPAPQPIAETRAPATASAVPAFRPGIEFPAMIIGEPASERPTGLGWAPGRLGGPNPVDGAGKAEFLRAAHRAACRIFATVLGPEANKAHRNHFHLDMAARKSASICE
jgi:hypothetical protein